MRVPRRVQARTKISRGALVITKGLKIRAAEIGLNYAPAE